MTRTIPVVSVFAGMALLSCCKPQPDPVQQEATTRVLAEPASTEVQAGSGYLSQSTQSLFFGLGEKHSSTINVRWPNGISTSHQFNEKQHNITISQPADSPSP